ncbi:MAG TPA: AAA family ATPase [Gammaproteobacteria bacterium]|nr:AAA family ATPase [Gammaproteobacteria bacterium]
MPDKHDLALLIHGHVPIITIETHEERRGLSLLLKAAQSRYLPTYQWTVTDGLQRLDLSLEPQHDVSDPQDALRHIESSKLQGIYILLDFETYLDDPINIRLLKEIAMMFDGDKGKLVLLSHKLSLPDNLKSLSASFSLELPDAGVLEQLIRDEAQQWQSSGQKRVRTDRETLDKLIQNLSGLTHRDAKRLIRNAIVDDGAITESDLPEVMQAKYRLLNQDDVLSFEFETAHFSELGGMRKLKSWLNLRKPLYTQNKKKSLDIPKGILLLGVQGCGKSLAAKAVAGIWGTPLLRLDFGRLYDKYVGETEKNLRQALHTAEVMSPCVLWVDELEKGIAAGSDDQGTSKRLLGTLLTWMSEKNSRVFIVATANQIDALPPELIRKGRLDEIFFVDLPNHESRAQIFKIHLEKRDIEHKHLDLDKAAAASNGFSGSEIEQAIVSAIYACHGSQQKLNTEIILDSLNKTRPLSVVMAEKINHLRRWANERTVPVD